MEERVTVSKIGSSHLVSSKPLSLELLLTRLFLIGGPSSREGRIRGVTVTCWGPRLPLGTTGRMIVVVPVAVWSRGSHTVSRGETASWGLSSLSSR